ncbi:hypothetical protein CGMCC3_g16657 [Colletotrichum fructicola]|nr:uncharacterized protein CGMCC3_g16657 [Colletotrichum fructicola]KAE9567227.1 hypothetical protein CGMCC3_g16657 [Colletotrichum fructicola]
MYSPSKSSSFSETAGAHVDKGHGRELSDPFGQLRNLFKHVQRVSHALNLKRDRLGSYHPRRLLETDVLLHGCYYPQPWLRPFAQGTETLPQIDGEHGSNHGTQQGSRKYVLERLDGTRIDGGYELVQAGVE